jgi:hypothetical protein
MAARTTAATAMTTTRTGFLLFPLNMLELPAIGFLALRSGIASTRTIRRRSHNSPHGGWSPGPMTVIRPDQAGIAHARKRLAAPGRDRRDDEARRSRCFRAAQRRLRPLMSANWAKADITGDQDHLSMTGTRRREVTSRRPLISGFSTRAERKASGQTLRVVWARHRAAEQPDGGPSRVHHCLLQRVMAILHRVFSVRSRAMGEAQLERTWHYPSANRARLQFAAASFRNCSGSGPGRKGRQPPLSSPLENPGE